MLPAPLESNTEVRKSPYRGLTVSASDPAPGAETFLREFVTAAWPSLARLSPLPAEPPWAALRFHTQPEAAVAGAEFIQESAPEREELKRTLLARLDAVLDPEIVIASSSSGLLMSRVQVDCRHPERCVVGHPFNPPHLVPLVEVVGGGSEAIERALAFYTAADPHPPRGAGTCRQPAAGGIVAGGTASGG
jgi:carnitine 3-dehydrogenase